MNGLALRIRWGDQRLHSEVLPQGTRGFTVGSAAGVDFPTGDVQGAEQFTLVAPGDVRTVRFARGMNGSVWRGDVASTLTEVVARGEAVPDEGGFAVTLGDADAVVLELGALSVEALPVRVPAKVEADPLAGLDLRMLNILAAVFVLAFVGVLSAVNAAGEEFSEDDGTQPLRSLTRFVTPPQTKPKPAPVATKMEDPTPSKASTAPPKKQPDDAPVSKGKNPKELAQQLGKFVNDLFAGTERGGDPLGVAIGGIRKAGIASTGINGMALKGNGNGGGGGELIGFGGINRPGRGSGHGGTCGIGKTCGGDIGGKTFVDPTLTTSVDVNVIGMDKELIRQVIHSHRDQVRFCYELGLTKNPQLVGKTAVFFVITGSGDVTGASVVDSTVKSPELETCIAGRVGSWKFPKPPGGGTVRVTYPFVFQRAGR